MNDSLVSIIIPIYNVESYVGQCVQSVLSQSYERCEIILVDDGSQDESLRICQKTIDEYCRNNVFDRSRIKIISQTNLGVSHARNVGVEVARGTLLTFVDSDDWIGEKYVENMIKAYDGEVEMVVSGMCLHMEDGQVVNKKLSQTASYAFNGTNVGKIADLERGFVFNGVHRKLFRSDIIRDKCLSFDENSRFGEDLMFVFSYLPYVNKISQVMNADYHYRCGRKDSLTAQAVKYRFEEDYHQWKVKQQMYVQKGLWNESLRKLLYMQLWGYIDNGIMSSIKCYPHDYMPKLKNILALNEIEDLIHYKKEIPSSWISWSVFHRATWPFKLYSKLRRR